MAAFPSYSGFPDLFCDVYYFYTGGLWPCFFISALTHCLTTSTSTVPTPAMIRRNPEQTTRLANHTAQNPRKPQCFFLGFVVLAKWPHVFFVFRSFLDDDFLSRIHIFGAEFNLCFFFLSASLEITRKLKA